MNRKLFQRNPQAKRSDAVRVKRSGRPLNLKRPQQTTSSSAFENERMIPPVMSRNGTMGTPMAARTSKKARRHMVLPMGVPGVEMRLPSIPTIHVGWRLFSFVLAAALVGVLFFLWNSPEYRVEEAQFNGLKRLRAAEFNAALKLGGEPIFVINPQQIQDTLKEKFPELSSVTVDIKIPAQIIITVKERQPVLAWKQNERTTWIDADGVSFAARGEDGTLVTILAKTSPPMMPLDKNAPKGQYLPKSVVKSMLALAKLAPPNTPIVYDSQTGLGWQDERGWQVYFGTDLSRIDDKMKIYQATVSQLSNEGIQPYVINVAYLNAPYYRLEP
jgi:cell division protein FtsQ